LSYQAALSKARSLEAAARSVETLRKNNLVNTLEALKGDWTGARANEYIRKATAIDTDMQKLVKQINDAAESIRRIAENTRRAELRAITIGQNRTY